MKAYVTRNTKFAATVAAALFAGSAFAQTTDPVAAPQLVAAVTAPAQPLIAPTSTASDSSSVSPLPDAPSALALRAFVTAADGSAANGGKPAPKYEKYISPDETAQPITAGDKVVIGLRDLYSPEDLLAWVASAGYEQATNGSPNYGTNSTAFGKRFAAAAARETTQGLFTDVVFSPLLHTDPRYYVEGSQSNFFRRAFYAATRVLITKTDSGKTTVNAALLLGYGASTALSTAYYPQINRNAKDGLSEYGGSLGGAAIGFLVDEFVDDALRAVHLKKK
jgi:hypothetical protein